MVGRNSRAIKAILILDKIENQVHTLADVVEENEGQEEIILIKRIKDLLDLYGYSPDDVTTISQMQWGN